MFTSRNLQFGILLLQQHRFQDAEQEFRKELAQSPENAFAHAMLATALIAQDRSSEAIAEANRSIELAPDRPQGHHILALALFHADRYQEALASIRAALRYDTENAQFYELQGKIHAAMGDWKLALESARLGLGVDAQDVDCANLEAMALVHLGRQGEASSVIETALHRDPENAMTHANLGWADLHAGKYESAVVHFREALRLRPNLEWARSGIVEAMKARSIFYQPILRYFLWMERLPGNVRWGLILGLWVLMRLLRPVTQAVPAFAPFVTPLLVVYLSFAFMTWISRPLFNLFLRLDKVGRLALSKDELVASNWLGLCVFGGLGVLLVSLFLPVGELSLAGIGLLAMAIPVAGVFQARGRKGRLILTIFSAALALVGLLGLGMNLWNLEAGATLLGAFVIGWVLYTWVWNFVANLK